MPSSSTSRTFQERCIFYHFKVTYARLRACHYDQYANLFTRWYVDLLEKPGELLQEEAYRDIRAWNEVSAHADKKKDSENIALVGNLTADVGAILFQFGRSQEAAMMCDNADQVYQWSKRLEEEEGKWQRS